MSVNRADLHVHTTFSDGLLEPEDAVNYAVTQTRLRVLAITDHNTIDGARQAQDYWQHHQTEFGQIEVVIGEEVSTTTGHILGLFLHEAVPPHLSPDDTVRCIHEQGGLAIAAHPFTHLLWFSDLKGIGRQIADLSLDGVEVRNSVPSELYANWFTAVFNARHRRHTPVGGSDCHYLPMLGRTHTRFDGETAADLREAIAGRTARPGGWVNGPLTVAQFVRDQLRRRQLPFVLPDDRHYRWAGAGLTVDVEELRDAAAAVLHCQGRWVRENADVFKDEATQLLDGGLRLLVADLTQVDFVDSAGLGSMVAMQKRARQHGGELVLCGVSEGVALSLRLVRLDRVLGTYTDKAAAVRAVKQTAAKRR